MQSFFPAMAEMIIIMLTKTPIWVRLWLLVLITLNMVLPIYYYKLNPTLSQVVMGVFNVGAVVMTLIKANYGFVKLLGLGHIFWIPMVFWIGLTQLDPLSDNFQWLVCLIIFNSTSLGMDILDVLSYKNGNRAQAFIGVKLMTGQTVKKLD